VYLLKTIKGPLTKESNSLRPYYHRAQHGNISLDFDLIQMRGTCRATAAHGGARGTDDGRPGTGTGDGRSGVAKLSRARVDVGDEGPEQLTMGNGQKPRRGGAHGCNRGPGGG
jgi:hypothetical protein